MLNNYSAAVDCFARALAFVVNVVGIVRTWPTRNPALPILEVLRGRRTPVASRWVKWEQLLFLPAYRSADLLARGFAGVEDGNRGVDF